MAFRSGQFNFSKGVLSKELWGRADIAPYSAGVRQGTNAIILKYGGLTKRPGTRFAYEIKDGSNKLFPFEGAYEASYAMLMGQGVMRLGALGGMIIEDKLKVEAVTLANPTKITASYHGYSTGDEVFFQDSPASELNGRILPVTVVDTHNFTVPVDGTSFTLGSDSGGTVRSAPPAPPPSPPPVPPPPPPPPPPNVGGGSRGDLGGGGRGTQRP